MDRDAYVYELEAKLSLLERFVRYLVLFGVDGDLLAKAEEAMWVSQSVSNGAVSSGSSTIQLAVDSTGSKTRADWSERQLAAVLSLETICDRKSKTDLLRLEEETLAGDTPTMGDVFTQQIPSPSQGGVTSADNFAAMSVVNLPADVDAESSCQTPGAHPISKPLRIRAPLSLDVSPRKMPPRRTRKLTGLGPSAPPSFPSVSPARPSSPCDDTSEKAKPDLNSTLRSRSRCQSRVHDKAVGSHKIGSSADTTDLERAITRRKSAPALKNRTNSIAKRTSTDAWNELSSNSSQCTPQATPMNPSLRRRPSLYQPTLSSSLKSASLVRDPRREAGKRVY